MNSKTIVRRTLPLIIALAIVIIVAVSCTLFSRDKEVPQISKPNEAFLTVDGIKVSNGQIYKDIKFSSGVQSLMDLIDKELLQKTKNAEGVDYYSAVSEEAIDEEIEKAIFLNGRGNDEEANEKTIANWKRTQYLSYGQKTEEDYKNAYRLTLAKRQYTRDQLAKDENLIKDTDITTYYDANYEKSYWVVVVKYNTLQEAKNALAQLNIIVEKVTEEDTKKEIDKWVWAGTKTPLTLEEIKQAHIDLYNNANAFKAPGYPNNADPSKNLILGANQYTITDGKIVFNTTLDENEDSPKNLFYNTTAELNKLSSSLTNEVSGMDSFTKEAATLEKTYIRNPLAAGSNYYFALKIDFVLPEEIYDEEGEVTNEELKDEIFEKVLDTKVTSTAISENMAKLRKGLVIYDAQIEASYISSYDPKHKETKEESKTVVAEITGTDIKVTADELFVELTRVYGAKSAYSLYLREMILRSEHNDIYNVDTKKVLNKTKWEEINEQLDQLKTTFANGQWVDPSYGWNNFLRDYYNLEDEDALRVDLVYSRALTEYNKTLYKTTEEVYTNIYQPKMQEIYDKYFSASGIHLLISKNNEAGNPISPLDETSENKWTAYEKELAKELYDLVLDKLSTIRPDKIQTFLQTTIISEYENAPKFVANKAQTIEGQPVYSELKDWINLDSEDYLYSKFKSAGLSIKFETLSNITPGQMVEPFENAVRTIWEKAETNNSFGDTKIIYDKTLSNNEYLETEFGYHVYVNTNTVNRPNIKSGDEVTLVGLPAYKDIMVHERTPLEGEETRVLTNLETRSISTFYSPIRTEMQGQNYQQIQIANMLLDFIEEGKVDFANDDFLAVYEQNLKYTIELSYENLKYFKAE